MLQDPMDISNQIISRFDYRRRELDWRNADKNADIEEQKPDIEMTSMGKRIMKKVNESWREKEQEEKLKKLKVATKKKKIDPDELLSVPDFIKERKELKDWKHERHGTGRVSTSVTSTVMDLQTRDERRELTEMEMYTKIWNKVKIFHEQSYISIKTNFGDLNVQLFADRAARTCYSFLELVYKNEFEKKKFRRMIEGKVLELFANEWFDKKLDSVDKSEKLRHTKAGFLTVETDGDLNSIGITLSAVPELDSTHTIFGEIVGGMAIVQGVAEKGLGEEGRPKVLLEVEKVQVFEDPFREACRNFRREILGVEDYKEKKRKEKEENNLKDSITSRILNM